MPPILSVNLFVAACTDKIILYMKSLSSPHLTFPILCCSHIAPLYFMARLLASTCPILICAISLWNLSSITIFTDFVSTITKFGFMIIRYRFTVTRNITITRTLCSLHAFIIWLHQNYVAITILTYFCIRIIFFSSNHVRNYRKNQN